MFKNIWRIKNKPVSLYQKVKDKHISDMTTNTTYRTTLNGTKWMLETDKFGCALMIQNWDKDGYHFSGNYYRSEAEANAYLDSLDKAYLEPKKEETYEIPADYYGVRGRYYGD